MTNFSIQPLSRDVGLFNDSVTSIECPTIGHAMFMKSSVRPNVELLHSKSRKQAVKVLQNFWQYIPYQTAGAWPERHLQMQLPNSMKDQATSMVLEEKAAAYVLMELNKQDGVQSAANKLLDLSQGACVLRDLNNNPAGCVPKSPNDLEHFGRTHKEHQQSQLRADHSSILNLTNITAQALAVLATHRNQEDQPQLSYPNYHTQSSTYTQILSEHRISHLLMPKESEVVYDPLSTNNNIQPSREASCWTTHATTPTEPWYDTCGGGKKRHASVSSTMLPNSPSKRKRTTITRDTVPTKDPENPMYTSNASSNQDIRGRKRANWRIGAPNSNKQKTFTESPNVPIPAPPKSEPKPMVQSALSDPPALPSPSVNRNQQRNKVEHDRAKENAKLEIARSNRQPYVPEESTWLLEAWSSNRAKRLYKTWSAVAEAFNERFPPHEGTGPRTSAGLSTGYYRMIDGIDELIE